MATRSQARAQLSRLRPLLTAPHDPFTGDLAWANPLNVDEREDMRRELAAALLSAILTKDWNEYNDALSAWRLAAEVAGDSELEADLLAAVDESEEVPLRRP